MNGNQNSELEITSEDSSFLVSLGFIEEIPDEEAREDGAGISYLFEVKNHPFIDDLTIFIAGKPFTISAYGKHGHEPFMEKPFNRKNVLSIMEFLGLRT